MPLPASGISTRYVDPSGLLSTWIGSCISPDASALAFRSAIAVLNAGAVATLDGDDRTARSTRERVLDRVERLQLRLALRQRIEPAVGRVEMQRGKREDEEHAAEAIVEITGCRRTGSRIAPQKRLPSPLSRRSRCRNGIRPFSTRSPSFESTAGSTVSEPIIATATTIIVPIANDMNVLSPESSMPAIAMMTVKPEINTARPEVAAAASIDARSLRPARRSSRARRR